MKSTKFNCLTLGITLIGLCLFALPTIIIDPYFHYHAPVSGMQYILNHERYQNDGITKHFEYDALVTGTSMTENFKTSQVDTLFKTDAVKVPFYNATYKEINDNITVATEYNDSLRLVIRALDGTALINDDKDKMGYDVYPAYLYDRNPCNDVNYVLNKEIFFGSTMEDMVFTKQGGVTTTFDDYAYWGDKRTFERESVIAGYERPEKEDTQILFDGAIENMIYENVKQNVIDLIEENPQIDFYLFFPPYSICWWDSLDRSGKLQLYLDAEKMTMEMLLRQENVHLFAFETDFEMICDLDDYSDYVHYSAKRNEYILECMKTGEHRITMDNYEEYCESVENYYKSYDYDALFQ